jgi:glycosyltransferase involved in cell wall biosynthesis
MPKISVVISAYNEEKNIKDCLESIKWTDEIILVNNSSTDKTRKIASKFTPKIFNRPNFKMLNKNKNLGFSKAAGNWILNIDADERVTPELKKEIIKTLSSSKPDITNFEIPRKNIIFGKWIQHGLWWPDYHPRLFKKNKGYFPCLHVHEKIKTEGKRGRFKNPMLHYNYQTVKQYIDKLNYIYTDNEAENFLKSAQKIHWYDAIRMPVDDFLKNFFARQGYKDGLHGLVLSLLQAFYSMTVFLKVWEAQKFWQYNNNRFLNETQKEFKKSQLQIGFWFRKTATKSLSTFFKTLLSKKETK